jgi:hypothetical protein
MMSFRTNYGFAFIYPNSQLTGVQWNRATLLLRRSRKPFLAAKGGCGQRQDHLHCQRILAMERGRFHRGQQID